MRGAACLVALYFVFRPRDTGADGCTIPHRSFTLADSLPEARLLRDGEAAVVVATHSHLPLVLLG